MKTLASFVRFFGFNTQGDLGPYTFYTDKRKGLVFFLRAPPLQPPSKLQTTVRNNIRLAAMSWKSLNQSHRDRWELASKKAHLKITGYNLFVFWTIKHDDACIHTIERLTNLNLIPLEYHL